MLYTLPKHVLRSGWLCIRLGLFYKGDVIVHALCLSLMTAHNGSAVSISFASLSSFLSSLFPISLFFFPPPSSLSLSLSPPLLPLSPPLILSHQPIDHKNIRRRVYDALNVLMAMNIISKEKKDIKWIGLPTNSVQECQHIEV